MEKSSVEVWLWLLLVMQPHNRRLNFILRSFGYDAVRAASYIRDGRLNFLNDKEKRRAEEVRMGEVRKVIRTCEDNDVSIVCYDSDEYPELLRHIEDPPIVLFVAGTLKGLNDRLCVSAVGTRKASEYGIAVTKEICGSLAERGAAIISGLAVGLDSAAHRACLDAGGMTVGVCACGILVNYPTASAQLKRDIVEGGGAVISELLPNARNFAGYFHSRNRIISGLSHGTIVLEAGEKSGSLITAACAAEQGREIFCIPPYDILSNECSGVIPLLREGAAAVYSYTDVLNAFPLLQTNGGFAALTKKIMESEGSVKSSDSTSNTAPKAENEPKKPVKPEKKPKKAAKKTDAGSDSEKDLGAQRLAGLSPLESEIIKLLFERPEDEDGIICKTEKDFAEVSEALTTLEIMGFIVRNMDGMFEPRLGD